MRYHYSNQKSHNHERWKHCVSNEKHEAPDNSTLRPQRLHIRSCSVTVFIKLFAGTCCLQAANQKDYIPSMSTCIQTANPMLYYKHRQMHSGAITMIVTWLQVVIDVVNTLFWTSNPQTKSKDKAVLRFRIM